MADTPRTLAQLQALLADNTTGDISEQDVRDFLVSVFADVGYGSADATTSTELKDAVTKKHLESHNAASHSDITSAGADIEDAVTKKHAQNTDTALGAQSEALDMNTHKVVGVVDPTTNQEAATKKYVDDNGGGDILPVFKLPNPALNMTIANRVDHTQSTNSKGAEPLAIGGGTMYNTCWFYSGKYNRTYFSYIESGGAEAIESFIFYYDHDSNAFSSNYSFGIPRIDADDSHSYPVIIANNEGNIVSVREELQTASNHNSPFLIRITDNPEDLSAYTEYTKLNDYHSYPNLQILSDGTLFITARYGNASSDHYRRCLYKSTDGGYNWKDLNDNAGSNTVYAHFGSSPAFWAYGQRISNANRHGLFDIINLRQEAGTWLANPNSYFLYSPDGDTWGNIKYFETGHREGFSKNVKTSGYLTKSELDTNFIVDGDGTTGHNQRVIRSATVSFNNHIYLVMEYGYKTDATTTVITARNFMYYNLDTSSWVSVPMDDVGLNLYSCYGELFPISYDDYKFDYIVLNQNNGNIEHWRTENKGINWRKLDDINTSGAITYVKMNANYQDSLILSIVANQDMGTYSDIVTATFSKAI